jgi:hypothetical protein
MDGDTGPISLPKETPPLGKLSDDRIPYFALAHGHFPNEIPKREAIRKLLYLIAIDSSIAADYAVVDAASIDILDYDPA